MRVAVIVAALALALVAAQTCQKNSIRVTKEQAIQKAAARVDFEPQRTQIRFLRQGLTGRPYWVVSLSRPGARKDEFTALAVVRINANTGKVETVRQQR